MKKYAPFIAMAVVMVVAEILRRHPNIISNENLSGLFVCAVFFALFCFSVTNLIRGQFFSGDEFSATLITKKSNPVFFYSFSISSIIFSALAVILISSDMIRKTEPNQTPQTTIMADTPAAAHPSRQP